MSVERPFLANQPKDGETIIHCGHLGPEHGPKWRWIEFIPPATFGRPDGSTGLTRWMLLCKACHREAMAMSPILDSEANIAKLAPFIRGDDVWHGDEPIIREVCGDA